MLPRKNSPRTSAHHHHKRSHAHKPTRCRAAHNAAAFSRAYRTLRHSLTRSFPLSELNRMGAFGCICVSPSWVHLRLQIFTIPILAVKLWQLRHAICLCKRGSLRKSGCQSIGLNLGPRIGGQKMGSEGSKLAESDRGAWFWSKRHSICTPLFFLKIERTSSLFSGGGKLILPQILEPRNQPVQAAVLDAGTMCLRCAS